MTMYVPAPENESIRITNLYGEAMTQEEGPLLPNGDKNPAAGKMKPATAEYQRFLLDRTTDEKFFTHGSKKEGIDALELMQLARTQIAATKCKLEVHVFDTEVAKRLQACILHPTSGHLGNVALEHNWIEWALLWKQLSDKPPAVLALPGEDRPAREKELQAS